MAEKPIENCELRFQFKCPKQWAGHSVEMVLASRRDIARALDRHYNVVEPELGVVAEVPEED